MKLEPPERVLRKIEELATKAEAAKASKATRKNKGIDRLQQWRAANPEKVRAGDKRRKLGSRYGLTPEEWEGLFNSQGRKCAIPACGSEQPRGKYWHTDHCHKTGAVRGILCRRCNLTLGNIQESPELLDSLAEYLRRNLGGNMGSTVTLK